MTEATCEDTCPKVRVNYCKKKHIGKNTFVCKVLRGDEKCP